MKMKIPDTYESERSERIPCNNKECQYWNQTYEEHCDGTIYGEPAVCYCKKYCPEMKEE